MLCIIAEAARSWSRHFLKNKIEQLDVLIFGTPMGAVACVF